MLKDTLELRGRAKAVTFFVAYAPTETQNARNIHAFWITLDRAAEKIPRHEKLVRVDGCQRSHREEGVGRGRKQG